MIELDFQRFWHCEAEQHTHYTCPGSDLFDAQMKTCNVNFLVDCGERLICDDCDQNCDAQVGFLYYGYQHWHQSNHQSEYIFLQNSGCKKHQCTAAEDGVFCEVAI